ncbi:MULTISPECIES: helix-turn-helix domain-containing protein [Metabacillus]|uniref:helix-turn-helix domain-containing protein n=1 Tax=Metabacillus TaxID=2675233 RepID=UPI000C80DFDF|nr:MULTISPECIES: helix-turn-helix transcriptional regulator [Metabacillus]MCM3443561.1 helix-turn-helix domain-containing protein [Metabacillus halosaccharovorans]PMC35026.1 transcriptional regulator [Bacillus sp. UMB0899]
MKIDVKIKFGQKVRYHRRKKGFSQEELGDLTDLHQTYISDVERGLRNISLENIYEIAHALDVRMCDLLNFD